MEATESAALAGTCPKNRPTAVPVVRKPRQCVLDACKAGAWEIVGGIPLIGRMLYHVDRVGIKEIIVISSENRISHELNRWLGNTRTRLREAKGCEGTSIASNILSLPDLDRCFLFLDSAHLMDPRLIEALAAASKTTLAFSRTEDQTSGVVRAGFLHAADVCIWADEGAAALIRHSSHLFPQSIDPFSPELRGPLTPYFLEVRSASEAREATRLLIQSQQKHVMDLPAEFIDPPFKNALTFWLCHTPVTPNMVTLMAAAVAILVAWLFWHGYLVAGALLTFAVEVLDGVDGQLARTKLQYSKLGRYEHILDYFCENSWYLALGVGLSHATSGRWAYFPASLLILSDTIDNILYTLAGRWHGKSIDLFSPFDAAFRRIAGRRNIYGAMFIVGFALGFPWQTFAAAALWAAVTAAVHLVRLIQFGRAKKRLVT